MSDTVIYGEFHRPDPTDDRDEDEILNEPEGYRFEFKDGSVIVIYDMEDPEVELPHRKTSRLWMAEEAANRIEEDQLDKHDSINLVNSME